MGTDQIKDTPPIVVTEKTLRQIEKRLKARFRAFFRPGEKFVLKVEDENDFVYGQLILGLPDDSFSIDLEAAVIAQDQDPLFMDATTSRDRLLGAIEFLSTQMEEYFRSQRRVRFHIDWRVYPFESAQIRFRGRRRHPDLEDMASALLNEDQEEPR